MSDLVERLRKMADMTSTDNDLLDIGRAADEIERLRRQLAEWQQAASVEAGLRREFLARAEKAEAERDDALKQLVKCRETLDSLVTAMDICHADPVYQGVWTCAHIHCGPYKGPKYETAFNAAKSLLAETDDQRGRDE